MCISLKPTTGAMYMLNNFKTMQNRIFNKKHLFGEKSAIITCKLILKMHHEWHYTNGIRSISTANKQNDTLFTIQNPTCNKSRMFVYIKMQIWVQFIMYAKIGEKNMNGYLSDDIIV